MGLPQHTHTIYICIYICVCELCDEYCIYVFGLLFNEERPTAKHTVYVCVCVVFVYDNFDGRKLCVWMNLIDDCVGFLFYFVVHERCFWSASKVKIMIIIIGWFAKIYGFIFL